LSVKFVDPIPAVSSRTQMEQAAIVLSRMLISGTAFPQSKKEFTSMYVDCLIKGTPLDPSYRSEQEITETIHSAAKADEVRRLARQDAKEERDKRRQEKQNSPEK
jgi:hypothetical protein